MSEDQWGRYDRWNKAIAECVFSPSSAGEPAYLDLEDDVLAAITVSIEGAEADPQRSLIDAVVGTMDFDGTQTGVFAAHLDRLRRWRSDGLLSPPPTLALLALLSLVAENMHSGDGIASHNFYDRLQILCGLTDDQRDRVRKSYYRSVDGRAASEVLWSSLNEWLERLEGARGIPTAFAVGHAHIGLPLSQALVRRADRERFTEMFQAYRLPPRSRLSSADMERIIDEWITREPCPASSSLKAIWMANRDEVRGRIAAVACQILLAWSGGGQSTSTGSFAGLIQIRASATLRTFPPPSRLQTSFLVPWSSEEPYEEFDVLGDDGSVIGMVEMVPVSPGQYGPASEDAIDASSFLGGELILSHRATGQRLVREPRRVLPMRRDDLTQSYVETERVELSEDTLVIATAAAADDVAAFLALTAQPGWVRQEDLEGVPDGWVAFTGVEIVTSVAGETFSGRKADLNLLQPIASSQATLQGGMSLPGHMRKWSSGRPPEVRAAIDRKGGLEATISCVRPLVVPTPSDRSTATDIPALTWDLEAEDLPDGDYEVVVNEISTSGGPSTHVGRMRLRLRSADNPAPPEVSSIEPIGHVLDNPLWPLTAETSPAGGEVRGAWSDPRAAGEVRADLAVPPVPAWFGGRQERRASPAAPPVEHAPLVVPSAAEDSCRLTGEHRWQIETVLPGRRPQLAEGYCSGCGMVRMFPTTGRRRRSPRGQVVSLAPIFDVGSMQPIASQQQIDFGLGFDALCHVGGGPYPWFERIALQIEPTRLFTDVLLRTLECLGHVDVERDPLSLAPTSWAVAPPTLAQLPDGSFSLVGFRSEGAMVLIEDVVSELGASLAIKDDLEAPPVIEMRDLSDDGALELAGRLTEVLGREVEVALEAAERMTSVLPPLSSVIAVLPVTGSISAGEAKWWDPTVARYVPVGDTGRPGAFQIGTFARRYIFRREGDIGGSTALVGDARTVKYAAAFTAGLPLAGYDEECELIWCPKGAELPGLYGRAACLASGLPPRINDDGILEYRRVPAAIGRRIVSLLMS